MSKEKQVVQEIQFKIEDYESDMSNWIEDANLYADLYTIRPPKKKNNTFSNPRLPEMHRAVEALATTGVRMMTAHDPYLDVRVMDFDVPDENVYLVQKTLETQLRVSQYKAYLTKAFRSLIPFGTVFVEEPFEWVALNPFGRRIPVTRFLPRSILQMGFDRSSIDIQFADWIYTNDIISKGRLEYMAKNDAIQGAWIKSNIDAALNDQSSEMNDFITKRLDSANYKNSGSKSVESKEIITYQGKLDCLNDGREYICCLVNRKYLVKFVANPDQTGNRNFRIAKWVDFEAEPLGYGLGRLLGKNHRAMDSNRQKTQDMLSFGTYNMWIKSATAGINSQDLVVRPNKIITANDINGMKQLITDTSAALQGMKLEEMLKQDFRAASGATDTLQAQVTEATASEVGIVTNEAMRRLSVYVENIAEPLGRDHFSKMHQNNRMNLAEPFIISTEKGPRRVYPQDLNIDVDINIKIVTDKDYRPKRTDQLFKAIELASSIRMSSPDKFVIDTIPLYREIARQLDVNPDSIIRPVEEAAQLAVMDMQMKKMLNSPTIESMPIEDMGPTGVSTEMQNTPVGPVNVSSNQELPPTIV